MTERRWLIPNKRNNSISTSAVKLVLLSVRISFGMPNWVKCSIMAVAVEFASPVVEGWLLDNG